MKIGGWTFGIAIQSPGYGYRADYAYRRLSYRRLWFVVPTLVVTRRGITLRFGGVHYTSKWRDEAREWKAIREAKPRVYVNPELTPWDYWCSNMEILLADLDRVVG